MVGSVSTGEKEKAVITSVADQLSNVFRDIDMDGSGLISRMEFQDMLSNKKVTDNLEQIGVQPKHLSLLSDALFETDEEGGTNGTTTGTVTTATPGTLPKIVEGGESLSQSLCSASGPGKEISFVEFLKFVIQTRPQNPASVLDISQLRQYFCKQMESTFQFIDSKCTEADVRKGLVRRNIRSLQTENRQLQNDITRRQTEIREYTKEITSLENLLKDE